MSPVTGLLDCVLVCLFQLLAFVAGRFDFELKIISSKTKKRRKAVQHGLSNVGKMSQPALN